MKVLWGRALPTIPRDYNLDVDVVPKEIIVAARIELLKSGHVYLWLFMAYAIIVRPEASATIWNTNEPRGPRLNTDRRWERQVGDIVNMGLLAVDDEKNFRHWARLFLIRKEANVGRVIFSCRQSNEACKELPGINFPRMGDLLRKIDEITRGIGLFALEMDIRHAFFQNPMNSQLASHFGVSCKGVVYRMLGLVMGWKGSPYCQQAILWGMILKNIPAHLGAKLPPPDETSPPAWVEILDSKGKCIGIVTVFLDNILVLTSCAKKRDAWSAWIMGKDWVPGEKKQAENTTVGGRMKHYNVKVKTAVLTSEPTYLGVTFEYDPAMKRTKWTKIEGAGSDIEEISIGSTVREVASLIGWLMWDVLISLREMHYIGWALEMLSGLTKPIKRLSQWDVCANVSQRTADTMNAAKAVATTGDAVLKWTWVHDRPKTRIVLASDASKDTLAWLIMGRELGSCRKPEIRNAKTVGHRDIFLKELEAAVLAVEWVVDGTETEILLLCDNAAAVLAIRKGWSGVPGATPLLTRMWAACKGKTLTVLRVPGKDNVADSPTRGAELEGRRLKASWAIVDRHDGGGGGPPATATATGKRRLEALIATAMDKKQGEETQGAKRGRDVMEQDTFVHGDSDEEEGQVEEESDEDCSESDVEAEE